MDLNMLIILFPSPLSLSLNSCQAASKASGPNSSLGFESASETGRSGISNGFSTGLISSEMISFIENVFDGFSTTGS